MMKYRDIEYSVVQGMERHVWKWRASVAGLVITGQAAIKSEAVNAAEKSVARTWRTVSPRFGVIKERKPLGAPYRWSKTG
jgi:hypothetical protein